MRAAGGGAGASASLPVTSTTATAGPDTALQRTAPARTEAAGLATHGEPSRRSDAVTQ